MDSTSKHVKMREKVIYANKQSSWIINEEDILSMHDWTYGSLCMASNWALMSLCLSVSLVLSSTHTHIPLLWGEFKLLRSRLNRQIWQTWCQYYQDTLNLGLSSLLSGWPWKVLNFQMHLEECDTSDFKSNIWFISNILYIVLSLFIMAPENY